MRAYLTRRTLIGSSLALAACEAPAKSQTVVPPLKTAPFAVGACVQSGQLNDPAFSALVAAQFSQVTPEWEMKMEAVLREDGGFDFARADAIAAFAAARGLRLHGHALVWYEQTGGPAFARLDGAGAAFAQGYRNYILAVAGRYRGRVTGWDVVNEPIADDGKGYRDCIWRRNLGMDYVVQAFRHAREADPQAVLFLNDYNLETNPVKRRSFLVLAEQLLKAGAPLGGLGTQTHLSLEVAPSAVATAIRELGALGLPVHVSELDISTRGRGVRLADPLEMQARLAGAVTEAFMALPSGQRYALTAWGVRDSDSWLRQPPRAGDGSDRPLLFDDAGRPKPAAAALMAAARA